MKRWIGYVLAALIMLICTPAAMSGVVWLISIGPVRFSGPLNQWSVEHSLGPLFGLGAMFIGVLGRLICVIAVVLEVPLLLWRNVSPWVKLATIVLIVLAIIGTEWIGSELHRSVY